MWKAQHIITALLIGAIAVSAQQITLTGKVTNRIGEPISGARVSLKNADLSTTTGSNGVYSFAGQTGISTRQQSGRQPFSISVQNKTLSMVIAEPSRISLEIFDLQGKNLKTISLGRCPAGKTEISFAGFFPSQQTLVLKASINNDCYYLKLIQIAGGGATLITEAGVPGQAIKAAAPAQSTDSLIVTPASDEYESAGLEIDAYTGTVDVTLQWDWSTFADPKIVYTNKDKNGSAGKLFTLIMGDSATYCRTVLRVAKNVARMLYFTPDEVRRFDRLNYFLELCDGVAAKWGAPPEISIEVCDQYITDYWNQVKPDTMKFRKEFEGVLAHELTHGYQWDKANINQIEGVADGVRTALGYFSLDNARRGGSYTDAYRTSGYFFAWLEKYKKPGFLRDFNRSMGPDLQSGATWNWNCVQKITGTSVEDLWDEYQAWLPR